MAVRDHSSSIDASTDDEERRNDDPSRISRRQATGGDLDFKKHNKQYKMSLEELNST